MKFSDYAYEIKEGLAISFQAILANKMRSALTMLGIVIGIVSVTLMGTAIEGLNRSFNENIQKLGADVLYVQKFPWFDGGDNWWKYRNRKDITLKQFKAVREQATMISAGTPSSGQMMSIKFQSHTVENVIVVGANQDYLAITGAAMDAGRFFSQAESDGGRPVAVLGFSVAKDLFPNETPIGKNVKVGTYTFRVVGVIAEQGNFLGWSLDNRVVVPITNFMQKYFNTRHGIQMQVKVTDLKQIEDAKEELRGILRKVRNVKPADEDDFAINQQELFIQTFNAIGGVIAGIGLFITALSLFVGAIGIMNIMFVSVTERTKEIGIRKAIGAKRSTILFQFLIESATLALIGGIVGLILSYPLSLLLNQVLPTSMPISVVVIAIIISILVGVVSGFLPANRASKMDPVDALRYE